MLRLIAVFKLLKAIVLIAAAIGAFSLSGGHGTSWIEHWQDIFAIQPGYRLVERALLHLTTMSPATYKKLGVGGLVYAALFLTEGTGLWLRRHWAEWLTVIITASLVPLEVFEIVKRTTAPRVLATLVNLAIVVYLLVRIRRGRHPDGEDTGGAASSAPLRSSNPA